ncbi:alcohol dehydrogenase catalytic domain-containing protein [Cnuibacter physcomitrellae]|uniref:zinc-binding dehydrogenase n=1 Tax=Cnuibacter physcomitrellae TaxID=1619308 RepID=UPI0021759D1C|nr:zinc-binding dehydrogenase [Cnuibacter physcomitrellae]MCS5498325.1 alcohol dehydrogenase catalytic domain-containing protein [Cnuibacter physcomitrellae]
MTMTTTTSAVLREVVQERPYSTSEPISFEELTLDDPGPTEVLVRIKAAGLCHSDLSVVNGDRVRPLPMALGHEAAGVIVATGDAVTDVLVGDHVVMVYVPSCGECAFCASGQPALCARGAASNGAGELLAGGRRLHDADGAEIQHHLGVSAFSQYAVVDRSSVVKVGYDVPYDVAALLGCAMSTGYGSVVRTADVRAGETVIVIGLGGVGLSAVIAAAAVGAGQVLAVDPVESKRALALELGATAAAAPGDVADLLAEGWDGGADWVFEAVGAGPVMEQAYRFTKRGGTTVFMGLPHPDVSFSVPALSIIAESRTIKGSYMGSTRPQEDIPDMVRLWREGRLPVERLISAHRPLSELNEALEALADGTAVRQILVAD